MQIIDDARDDIDFDHGLVHVVKPLEILAACLAIFQEIVKPILPLCHYMSAHPLQKQHGRLTGLSWAFERGVKSCRTLTTK